MPPRRDTRRSRQRRQSERRQATAPRELPYSGRNVRFFVIGILVIALGYFFLSRPPVDGFLSVTLAPILLAVGYCVLIPIALLIGDKRDETPTVAETEISGD